MNQFHEKHGLESISFCLKTSDMVGLAKICVQSTDVAVENLPILVELGDVELLDQCGLISDDHVDALIQHLVTVYPGTGTLYILTTKNSVPKLKIFKMQH